MDVVIHIDLLLDPIGHLGCQTLAAHIAFKGGAHFKDVEVNRFGRNGLLQPCVVVGLGKVDPVYLRTRIGLPGFQETAKQKIVKVLVVEPHKGKVYTLKFALFHIVLGGSQAHSTDFLPV